MYRATGQYGDTFLLTDAEHIWSPPPPAPPSSYLPPSLPVKCCCTSVMQSPHTHLQLCVIHDHDVFCRHLRACNQTIMRRHVWRGVAWVWTLTRVVTANTDRGCTAYITALPDCLTASYTAYTHLLARVQYRQPESRCNHERSCSVHSTTTTTTTCQSCTRTCTRRHASRSSFSRTLPSPAAFPESKQQHAAQKPRPWKSVVSVKRAELLWGRGQYNRPAVTLCVHYAPLERHKTRTVRPRSVAQIRLGEKNMDSSSGCAITRRSERAAARGSGSL